MFSPHQRLRRSRTYFDVIKRLAFYSFLFLCPDPQLARWVFFTVALTRLRLVSHGVSMSDPVSPPVRSDYLGNLLSRSHPKTAKIKSRIEIRRADKIEIKIAIEFRRKFIVFNILGIRKIYRYSRESREVI